eukprot:181498_1
MFPHHSSRTPPAYSVVNTYSPQRQQHHNLSGYQTIVTPSNRSNSRTPGPSYNSIGNSSNHSNSSPSQQKVVNPRNNESIDTRNNRETEKHVQLCIQIEECTQQIEIVENEINKLINNLQNRNDELNYKFQE